MLDDPEDEDNSPITETHPAILNHNARQAQAERRHWQAVRIADAHPHLGPSDDDEDFGG